MSKTFFDFLAKRIVKFFASREVKPGEKYHLQFEKESEVAEFIRSVYDVAFNESLMQPFVWDIGTESYESFSVRCGDQELLIAGTMDGVTEDFLIRIRNLVGTRDALFENKAVLFVHHTTLDSIVGGAIDLQHPSMPLSYQSIRNYIKESLENSDLDQVSKSVIRFAVDQIEKSISQDGAVSIYEFKEVLPLLEEGVSADRFPQLGLFHDPALDSYSEEVQRARLEENHQLFRLVQDAHSYGDPQTDLDRFFDEQGLERLAEEGWENLPFAFVKQSNDRLKQVTPPEYQGFSLSLDMQSDGISVKDQPEGDTKTKKRKRHILIFNPRKVETIRLEFQFDRYLSKEFLKNMVGNSAATSGKKIVMNHVVCGKAVEFVRFRYQENGANYDFNVAILPLPESLFHSIDQYTVSVKKGGGLIRVPLKGNVCVFNGENAQEFMEIGLDSINQDLSFQPGQAIRITIPEETIQESEGEIQAHLTIGGVIIPLEFTVEVAKPKALTGLEIYKMKREEKKDFVLKNDDRFDLGGREYLIKDRQLYHNLLLERKMVEQQALALQENVSGVHVREISVPTTVRQAYLDYVQYFADRGLLPSLASWNDEVAGLANRYVQSYISCVEELKEGEPLPREAKDLAYLGTVYSDVDLPALMFSPLHPLNVAYQLVFENEAGDEEIPAEILERLGAQYLCPYVFYGGEIYKPVHQVHAPEWIYYRRNDEARYHSSSNFVPKLVSEKIKEFTKHYSFLFDYNRQSPMKLNLINMGDCREVLQGIFRYYTDELKNGSRIENLIPFDVVIYGHEQLTAFEELSSFVSHEEVEQAFDLHLKLDRFSPDDLINAFRQKVRYYKRKMDSLTFEYAHISFYELDAIVDETSSHMDSIETGVALNGLMSSVTSTFVQDSYRTGFGTKYLKGDNELIRLTKLFNSLALASGKQNVFEKGKSIVTAFSVDNNDTLRKVYESSHWVTFIEPKFDLSFFERSDFGKDLLIIHYSDQFTSSNSYDAITVTQKTDQFRMMIEEFLAEKIRKYEPQTTKRIINMFNSLNGNWLLRLVGNKSQFPREKMSILSAVKFGLAYLADEETIWVPLSLEEILRVSGAVGLEQKGSPFSAKNLGVTGQQSDDLLMVGIRPEADRIRVSYYPVEVKIGRNQKSVISKALKQVHRTYDTIYTNLAEQSFKGKVYRDFLMQLALVSAQKMHLYGVWPDYGWDRLFEEEICSRLLSDDYELVEPDKNQLGIGAIVSFEKGNALRNEKFQDQTLVINLTEQDGYDFLGMEIGELLQRLESGRYEITKRVRSMKADLEAAPTSEFTKADDTGQTESEGDERSFGIENRIDVSGFETEEVELVDQKEEVTLEDESVPVQPKSTGPMKILFGHSTGSREPLYWYPTDTSKIMHTNTGIIGTMGTGKTQFTKSLIKQIHDRQSDNVNGTPIGILIFDYKGDYIKSDFVEATHAHVYQPYHLPFNPLALYKGQAFKPLLPLHTASTIKETIATAFNLGVKQQQFLNDLIMAAYEEKGIHKANPATWDRPAPTMYDVYRKFEAHEEAKEDSLYAALKQITDYELFAPDSEQTGTLFDMIEGVTVINLSGYDPSVQNLIVGITLDTFYSQMLTKGHSTIRGDYRELTKMILVDEADNFLSKDFASLKKIMKEGREFGVGVILSTQFMSHFVTSDNDYSQYILTWVVHRVSEIKKKEVQSIFNAETQNEIDQLMNKIRELPKHHSVVTSVSKQKYVVMEDMPFWKLLQS